METALSPSPALAIRWHDSGSEEQLGENESQSRWSDEWGGEDSNLRPADYESAALTN